MRKTRFVSLLLCLPPLIVACGADQDVVEQAPTRPVKTIMVEGGSQNAIRSFPGRVDATKRAELAFRVPGQLQEILVKEGDLVGSDQIIAKLDPRDFELVYEDRKATYDNSLSNFERARELVADGNISKMDFDTMEASYRSAKAALAAAEQDLEYTVLRSPFSGRIAERHVENFEDVLAKQAVFSLQNIDQLDIVIDLPESVVRMVRGEERDEPSLANSENAAATRAYAEFQGREGRQFPLQPKEIATTANDQTQTFRATFTMDSPKDFTVLPGMTSTVRLDLSRLMGSDSVRRVPVRAVQANSGLQPRVWVLDPLTMQVSAREVQIGRMTGSEIEITEGLDGGEEVVAVGAPYLAEGMSVTRMVLSEQAEPRPGDPE
ncbi:MAG: efflux RND transporter periplasmic adaptor subunit [Pseudomonadota bacterium]